MKTHPYHLYRKLIFALPCFALSVQGAVLVNLDATALPLGALPLWTNTGTVAGNFAANGSPIVTSVDGVKGVSLNGNGDYFTGPIAPSSVTGVNPNRSIEVWAYNPAIAGEETLVSWGKRGGPAGTNLAFNYGNSGAFGAVGHWDAADIGWINAGGAPSARDWHYLVYTYDGGGAAATGTTRVYADGVLLNSEVLGTLDTHPDTPFRLGAQSNAAGDGQGFNSGLTMARVRIHDTVLTPAEIAAKYTAERAQLNPVTMAYFDGYGIPSRTSFTFKLQDRVPASITAPATFTVAVGGIRAGWQVQGGEGIINGSITTPPIVIPNAGPVELTLRHRYNFEGDLYDGGVVMVSVNGGEFVMVEGERFTQNGYIEQNLIGNGVLKDKRGWNAASPGFASGTLISSIATIPGVAAGNTIRLQFLGAWDDGFTPPGTDWEIAGVTVKAGAATVLSEDFTSGNGGFTVEATGGGATFNYVSGTQPSLGALQNSKSGETTTFTLPINWTPGITYDFTLSGKSTTGANLVYSIQVPSPALPLAPARAWPVTIPGPAGAAGRWGVRTYLNEGINGAEDLNAMMAFLASSADRTPTLTPTTVVDTQEPDLSFKDQDTNANTAAPTGTLRDFPGEALSKSTNGGTSRDDNHVISVAHGSIQITEASDYTFSLRGDDGFFFRVNAATGPAPQFFAVSGGSQVDIASRNILYYATGTGDTNTRAVMYLTPGVYNLEYATWEGVGGFWYQVASAKGFFLNQTDTTTWRTIGYVPTPPPLSMVGDWTVQSTPASGMTQSDIPSAKIAVAAAVAANAAAATSLWPQINFFDPQSGGTGRIGGDVPWPRNTDADDNKWGMRMFGTLRIPVSGNYLIGFQGDDGTQITVGGANAGFTELLENVTNGGVIGRESTVMVNSGSLGAAANSNDGTDGEFSQEGALAGDANKALALDGVPPGNKVTVPYAPGMNPGASANAAAVAAPFTVEAWVKPTNTTGVQAVVNSMIAGANQNPSNGNDRSGYVLRFNGTDWQFYIGNEAIYCIILHAPGTVIADTWQHVVGLWDGTLAKLYIDGIKVAEAGVNAGSINGGPAPQSNGNPRANFAAPLYIGKRGFADWRFTGSVDEVAVYGSALAESVIISHKTNGLNAARTTPYATLVQASAPLAYYRLNETRKPRVDLNTITTDLPTGNNSTVGKIFLNAGDYPIDATFWEDGGGSYVEIFAAQDSDTPVYRALANSADFSGLVLVKPPGNTTTTVPPVLIGPGLTINANSALSISFQSVPGATYTLESSLNLGTWQAINPNILATGTTTTEVGTPGTYFFYTPAEPKRYYRIRNN